MLFTSAGASNPRSLYDDVEVRGGSKRLRSNREHALVRREVTPERFSTNCRRRGRGFFARSGVAEDPRAIGREQASNLVAEATTRPCHQRRPTSQSHGPTLPA